MFLTVGRKEYCEHNHSTFEEAQRCLAEHQNECRRLDKTSDRTIVEVESVEELEDLMTVY